MTGQRGRARPEEVEIEKGHKLDSWLADANIELTREAEVGGDTVHGGSGPAVGVVSLRVWKQIS